VLVSWQLWAGNGNAQLSPRQRATAPIRPGARLIPSIRMEYARKPDASARLQQTS
jgi:hypothetical protein